MVDYLAKYDYLENKDLPRLPIPELKKTLNKYLDTVECLLTTEEFEQTKKVVEKFSKGKGPELDEELRELAKKAPTSWLAGFWDTMYMELRCPNPIHVNPAYGFVKDEKRTNYASRGAALTLGIVQFHQKIASGKKETDMERTTPLCMSQYNKLLCATRIPKVGRDILLNLKDSKHVIVIAGNQFYKLDVYEKDGNLKSETTLTGDLKSIYEDSKTRTKAPIGVLTCEDRDVWAVARDHMIEYSKLNKQSLEVIDTAIFALVLENYSPKNRNEYSQMLLHGTGRNRYFDKSFQIIVAQNGDAGINQEHSGYDGHTILFLAQAAMGYWTSNTDSIVTSLDQVKTSTVEPLSFELSEKTYADIKSAEKNTDDLFGSVDTFVVDFEDFGKKYATSHKCSPDAFIQIAYQLAYYRLRGQVGSTYESSNTKRFYHGRTGTIRSCSKDSKYFCEQFTNPTASSKEIYDAFMKACETHVRISNESKNGSGVDRHLYGMQQLAKHNIQKYSNYNMPELYTDKAYPTMKTDMLSTSNSSGTPALNLFTFGPTAGEGFGLGYIVENNAFHVACTSFKGEASQFGKSLISTLHDIKKIVDENCKTHSNL
eukprot:gene268-6683_t